MLNNLPLLFLSVALSATRNVTSKLTATASAERSLFYFSQAVLFFVATMLIVLTRLRSFEVSFQTLGFGIIYGALLILSQWMLTLALGLGNTAVCSVVYSLGFIIPTVSGCILWDEQFTLLQGIGLISAVSAIIITVKKPSTDRFYGGKFVLAILTATVASGGLGIMQKIQQASSVKNQDSMFLTVAFTVAFAVSLLAYFLTDKSNKPTPKNAVAPAVTGICFGGANLCNTLLAGRLPSAVFFPTQNILTILLSTVAGIIIFKEKLTAKAVLTLVLGVLAVVLFSL